MSELPRHVEETPARQAQGETGLRWVLRISLALVVVAFAAIWLVYSGHRHEPPPPQISTTPNVVKETAAAAPPGSAVAQIVGRKEQTTGG
jgi:hypothetical protein